MPESPPNLRALRDLARTEAVPLRVRGACMTPDLTPDSIVEVRAARLYWPGDIVAFVAVEGGLTVHRVIGWGPASWTRPWRRWGLWTQADDGASPDAPVTLDRVLGRVSARASLQLRAAASWRLVRHLARRIVDRRPRGHRRPVRAA